MNKLNKISILGCGWLGLPLGTRLVNEGFTVKGSSRRSEKHSILKEFGIQPFLVDLQPEVIGEHIDEFFNCDLLIITLPPGRRRPDVETFYPRAIHNAISLALKNSCQYFIYTSSTGVYGQAKGVVNEESQVKPITASGKAVAQAEQLLNSYQTTILRLAGLVGPNRHPGRWLAGRTNLPDGDAPVNLVHQTDIIETVIRVIKQQAWNCTFNVCAANHPSKSDYYTWAAQQLNLEIPHFLPGGQNNKMVDSTVMRKQLGITFKHDNPYHFFID